MKHGVHQRYNPKHLVWYQIICRQLHRISSHSRSFWSANFHLHLPAKCSPRWSSIMHWWPMPFCSRTLILSCIGAITGKWILMLKSVIFLQSHANAKSTLEAIPLDTLGNITLLSIKSFTYLGVTVSSDQRWYEHVAAVSAKATHVLNHLRRNINFCSSEVQALASTFLVRPHLEYASASWDSHTTRDTQQLERVQHRDACFVHKDYWHTTSVSQLLSNLTGP